jgi:hypothetical protein
MDTKHPAKRDIVWRYFDVLKQSGEETNFTIHRYRSERPLEKLTFDHRQYDGVSAICEIARKLPSEGFVPPQFKVAPKPSLFKRCMMLLTWSRQLFPGVGRSWITGTGVRMSAQAFINISEKEWSDIQARKGNGTVAILSTLDVVAQKYLTDSPLPRLWMVPVGLYEKIDRSLHPQNKVAFVDVSLWSEGNQKEAIQSQLKRDLPKGLYWGSILTLHIVDLLGEQVFLFSLKFMHHFFRRTGTLTNVGSWSIPGIPTEEWWAVQVTTVKMSPVGVGMLEINGQLGLGFQFHPSLRWTPLDAQKFAIEWKKELLS